MTLESSTLSFNAAPSGGGAIADFGYDAQRDGGGYPRVARVTIHRSIPSDTPGLFTNDLSVNGLGALQDNGGPTPTRAPAASSPAVDTGGAIGCPASDQRGLSRPQGAQCDLGAVELGGTPPPPPPPPAIAIATPASTASSLGPHTFTVSAQDTNGLTATQSVSYTVAAGADRSSRPDPQRREADEWEVARGQPTRPDQRLQAHQEGKRGKRKPPVGTTFSFSLNEPATVTLRFTQSASGRKVHGKCTTPSRKNRHKPRCSLTLTAGQITFTAHPGTNKVRFAGRISRSSKLKPGRYTLQITAINAQRKRSTARSLSFMIVK